LATDTAPVPALNEQVSGGTIDTTVSVPAENKIFRQFCRYLGVGYCLSAASLLGVIAKSSEVVPLWWTVMALLSVYGSAVAMIVASFLPGMRPVRTASSALVIGYAATILTWPLVWNGDQLDLDQGMWFTQFNGVVALSAAITWRARWSLPYLLFVLVSVQFVNDAVRESVHNNPIPVEIAWSVCLSVMPYAVGVAAMRSGKLLDATRQETATTAADAAATVARARERARFNALTHDGVMATLLAAARHEMSDALVAQATDTLTKLDVLESGVRLQNDFDPDSAITELRGTTGEVDDSIRVVSYSGADVGTRYPGTVVRTMCAALAEALRNSVQHAGPDARRSVQVRADDNSLKVTVSDNGVGFDQPTVPAHRLGLAVSVRGRMSQLPGGSAEVVSSPGHGTQIDLLWRRPR
jgi:signal transduction histidine kinase